MNFSDLEKLTPLQAKKLLSFFVQTNKRLESEGMPMNAISFLGHAGIGKTSIITQFAEENNLDIEIIRLSNIDDAGELIGFPVKEFELIKKGKNTKGDPVNMRLWVKENEYEKYIGEGFNATGVVRTGYAPPAWLSKLTTPTSLLVIDDYSRGSQRFMNALMSIVNERSYYSWSLPQGCNVVLTGNPADEGDYQVVDLDMAQKSRFFEYGVKFNIDDWVEHAVEIGIDGRCINFFASYWSQVLYAPDDTHQEKFMTNPRQWTKFFNAIKYIPDFSNRESLSLIQSIGSGIVKGGINAFTTFINQNLDKLPEPKFIMEHGEYEDVHKKMVEVTGSIEVKDGYKPEVASIISQRIVLYLVNKYAVDPVTEKVVKRLEDLLTDEIFAEDLKFRITRNLLANSSDKYRKVNRKFLTKASNSQIVMRAFNDSNR